MGSPPFAFVSTVVTAISLSWVSSSVAAAPIVAATLVAFVRMPLLLVEAQLFSILLFIMSILVSCHDTVVLCFAVTISRHDFIVSRFAISLMWPSSAAGVTLPVADLRRSLTLGSMLPLEGCRAWRQDILLEVRLGCYGLRSRLDDGGPDSGASVTSSLSRNLSS